MKTPWSALDAHHQEVRDIVLAHHASNPRIFGSSSRGEDTAASELDFLIDPTPETTLLDIGAIRDEWLRLLGVPVDVVTRKSLPATHRDAVIAEAVAA